MEYIMSILKEIIMLAEAKAMSEVPVERLYKIFTKLNKDIFAADGHDGLVISLKDWQTNADQIKNDYEDENMSATEAKRWAKALAAYVTENNLPYFPKGFDPKKVK